MSSGDNNKLENEAKKESCPDPPDDDLSQLLDSALKDFGKVPPSAGGEASNSSVPVNADLEDFPPGMAPFFDQKMAQQAANEFQNMLRQLAQVQRSAMDQQEGLATDGAIDPPESGAEGMAVPDDVKFAESLFQNLNSLADRAQKITEADSSESFMNAIQELHSSEQYDQDFMPFMQGLMGSLLTKDMMYPPLKDMAEKYPGWLEANKDKISAEEALRYERQLGLIQESLKEYDSEREDETEEVAGKRFQKLVVLMQELQLCGHPPKELVGDLPPGWEVDEASGLPKVVNNDAAVQSCSIM